MDRFALGQGLLAFGGRQQLAAQNEAIRQSQFADQRNALAAQQEGVQKRIESAFGFYRDAPPDVQEKIAPLLSKWAVGNGADPVWVQSALSPKALTDKLPTKASIAMQAAGQDPMKALELMKETSGEVNAQRVTAFLPDGRTLPALFDPRKRYYRISEDGGNTFDAMPPKGTQFRSVGVMASGVDEAGIGLPAFAKTDKPTLRDQYNRIRVAKNGLAKAQSAYDAFREAPGSGGFTGKIADVVGGALGQIPIVGGTLEDGISLALTGGTVEENTAARTRATNLAADLLSEITGEESGRFTEAERDLAFQTLRQLRVSNSDRQIASAYRTFIEISLNSVDKENREAGEPVRFNTRTKEGALDYVNNLIKRGFTEEQAVAALKRRIRSRELAGE